MYVHICKQTENESKAVRGISWVILSFVLQLQWNWWHQSHWCMGFPYRSIEHDFWHMQIFQVKMWIWILVYRLRNNEVKYNIACSKTYIYLTCNKYDIFLYFTFDTQVSMSWITRICKCAARFSWQSWKHKPSRIFCFLEPVMKYNFPLILSLTSCW